MEFAKALDELVDGKKVRRESWPNDGTHLCIADEKLLIRKAEDNLLHPLTVSLGDILGDDWVICG